MHGDSAMHGSATAVTCDSRCLKGNKQLKVCLIREAGTKLVHV